MLVVAGPEAIRPRTALVGAGMSATGVLPERPGPVPSAISVLVFRIERHPEAQEVAESAEALGDLLDFDRDRAGSAAVAATLLRRLDMLAAAEGVSVALGGEAARPPGRADTGYQLVVGRDAGVSMGGNVEIHGGRVVTVGRDGKSSAWYGADFVLLGHAPTARATDFRLLLQQRRDRALLYDRPRSRSEEEGFSYRATRARQAARAEQIVRTVRSGAVDTAGAQVWDALGQPGADGPLPESLVERITDIGDYWRIDDALARGARHGGDRARRALGRQVRLRVGEALDRMLGLPLPPTAEFLGTDDVYAPTVPALRFELASSLVPIVDSTQDSGRFLYELIPDMRDRVLADTGVTGPPVRAREDPDLPPGAFASEVEGVPRSRGSTPVDARYEVLPAGPDDRAFGWPGMGWTAGAVLTPVHPRRGSRGLWRLVPVPPDATGGRRPVERGRVHGPPHRAGDPGPPAPVRRAARRRRPGADVVRGRPRARLDGHPGRGGRAGTDLGAAGPAPRRHPHHGPPVDPHGVPRRRRRRRADVGGRARRAGRAARPASRHRSRPPDRPHPGHDLLGPDRGRGVRGRRLAGRPRRGGRLGRRA